MSDGNSSQGKGAGNNSRLGTSTSDLGDSMLSQNKKNFSILKDSADAAAAESEAKLIRMFKEHLKETEELCLRFRANGSSITDTDVKLLGPRLKTISESFLKTTQETDMHIKQVEEHFDSKIREMKKNFEEGINTERKNCSLAIARLEASVVSEREKGASNLKEAVSQHSSVVSEMQRALEEQSALNGEAIRRHEKDFLMKQNAILSNLKKAASVETEKIQAESLANMEKAAKDAIQRQRSFYEMEKRAERVAAEKFSGMVAELRAKWEGGERKREEDIEARVRAEYEGRVKALEQEAGLGKKMAEEAQAKWMDAVTKQNYKHQEEMAAFSERCSRDYGDKVAGMMKRVTDQFNVYERQLMEKDSVMAGRTMDFEGKLAEMKAAVHVWKEDQMEALERKQASNMTALEAKYMKEIDGLLDRVGSLQASLKESEGDGGGGRGSRVRIDGILSGFISIKRALELAPHEQVAMLMKLLQLLFLFLLENN